MDQNLQQNLTRRSTWIRILYMLLFFFIYNLAEMVVFGVAVIQAGITLITGEPNRQLLIFGRGLSQYVFQIVQFFTFASEELPFPFGPWLNGGR